MDRTRIARLRRSGVVAVIASATAILAAMNASAGAPSPQWLWGFFHMGSLRPVWDAAIIEDERGSILYACGEFNGDDSPPQFGMGGSDAIHVAQWNGTRWSSVGEGLNSTTMCLVAWPTDDGQRLVAGGHFTASGATPLSKVAMFDGTQWVALGSGLLSNPWKLHVFDEPGQSNVLYACGNNIKSGVGGSSGVARWNGSDWEPVGALSGLVRSLAYFDDGSGAKLYAGGIGLSSSGGAGEVQRWDGSAWAPVGGPFNGLVYALAVFDDGSGAKLHAGGTFTTIGGSPAKRLAKWTGSSWDEVGGGLSPIPFDSATMVQALKVVDDGGVSKLCVGGRFASAGAVPASLVALWDGSTWSPFAAGIASTNPLSEVPWVRNLIQWPNRGALEIVCMGTFTSAGGIRVNGITHWNGTAWRGIGHQTWVNDSITDFKVWNDGSETTLLATGSFWEIGSENTTTKVNQVARWDGATWTALGTGGGPVSSADQALTIWPTESGDVLYSTGSHSASVGFCSVCRWNGTAWEDVITVPSQQPDDRVTDSTVFDDGSGMALYVVGFFTQIGGVSAHGIAKFDGTIWSAVGGGLTSPASAYARTVRTVDLDGDGPNPPILVVGGRFQKVGTVDTEHVAAWDGSTWTGFGMPFLGTSGEVSAIGWRETGKGRRLVIGGNFYEEFSKAYTHLAEWDGDQWVSIGTSPDSAIQSIEWLDDGSGSALYVGGSFKHIGGIETSMIARYRNDAWEALGGGLNSTSGGSLGVRAIAAYSGIGDATLYAGGNFTYTGSFETGTMFTKFFAGFGVASPAEAAAPSKARGTQGDVVIESKVTGSVPLGLQWLRDGVPLVDMLGVSGATTSKLTLDDATARNGGVFELVAANSNGASISAPIKLEAGIVGDIDGNGLVNGADLAIVLGSWGACAGCVADINGDGVADGADLAIVLGNWTG